MIVTVQKLRHAKLAEQTWDACDEASTAFCWFSSVQ